MSKRKLVRSGSTSFTVVLPIDWVRDHKLDAGSEVEIRTTGRHALVIEAPISGGRKASADEKLELNVDDLDDDQLNTKLLHAYISNKTHVVLKGTFGPRVDKIHASLKELIGLEIIDQKPEQLHIKNFFGLDKEMSPKALLQRMTHANKTMISTLGPLITKGLRDENLHELEGYMRQVQNQDRMIRKVIHILLTNPQQLRELEETYSHLLVVQQQAREHASIAKEMADLAHLVYLLEAESADAKLLARLTKKLEKYYTQVSDALRVQDLERLETLMRNTKYEKKLTDATAKLEETFSTRALGHLESAQRSVSSLAFSALI